MARDRQLIDGHGRTTGGYEGIIVKVSKCETINALTVVQEYNHHKT